MNIENCNCNKGGKRKTLKKRLTKKHKGGNYFEKSNLDNLNKGMNDFKNKFTETIKNTDEKLGKFGNNINKNLNNFWVNLKNNTRKMLGGNIASSATLVKNIKTANPLEWLNADGKRDTANWYGGKKTKKTHKKLNRKTKRIN